MNQEGLNYIEQLKKYSIGDVESLIESGKDKAGPFLMVVMSGIDAFGGACYGFKDSRTGKDNSRKRSIDFMVCKMRIDRPVAKFLYLSVSCGVIHEGMPKVGITYEVDYKHPEWSTAFRMECQKITLNVFGFANHYLNTIKALNCSDYKDYPKDDISKLMKSLPAVKSWVRNKFDQQTSTFYSESVSKSSDSSTQEPPPTQSASGDPSSG